jgi:pullulanase/glycogen debranching enzyme
LIYSESESEDDYSSDDDDTEFDYGDELDDDDEEVVRGNLRLRDSRHVFRNERAVVYGYWSKCPLG